MPADDPADDRAGDAAVARRAEPADAIFRTWAAPDGWACRTMAWLPAPGVAPRGSMIFAGGRGDFIEKNLEPIGHWRARGWRMTAFDWRGQGGSRGASEGGHLDSLDPLVDDLAALVAGLIRDEPGPHVVVGHSMGGHVLLRLLAERHPALDSAVLVAPMVRINVAPLPRPLAAAIARLMNAIGLGHRPAWRQPSTPWPAGSKRQYYLTGSAERYLDELWWWRRQPGFNLGAPSWGWLNAAFESSRKLTSERLGSVAVPTLFLGTDHDRLVSSAAIREAAALVPGAELEMFARSGHEILREADPIRLRALALIDSFLDRHRR